MKSESQKWGYLEGWLSVFLNTALFALKLWAGLAAGSVAMMADAWHTLSDTLTSLVVLIGFWISGKHHDREHPFGHGRAELIGSIIIAVLLAVVGFNFLKDSVLELRRAGHARFSAFGITVFAISVIIKEGLAQFSFWAGKKVNSNALKADAWHHRSDAVASLLIVIGALAGGRIWWIDGVLGILVSALILYAAYEITLDSSNRLLGEPVDGELAGHINAVIKSVVAGPSFAHHMHLHCYGEHREVTLHLRLPADLTVQRSHDMATEIEHALRVKLGIEPTIHVEPLPPEASTAG